MDFISKFILLSLLEIGLIQIFLLSDMQTHSEKKKFITAIAVNGGYYSKDETVNQILEFLKAHQQFTPNQRIITTSQSFSSFIELAGFVELGGSYYELLIGVLKQYPSAPPIFMIGIEREGCIINDEENLVRQKMISFEKDQKQSEYMRLRFPLVQKKWEPKRANLNEIYKALINIITHPLLIRKKKQKKNKISNDRRPSQKSISSYQSKEVTKTISNLYNDFSEMILVKQDLVEDEHDVGYILSRQKFFEEIHSEQLNHQLSKHGSEVNAEINMINQDIENAKNSKDMSFMFEKTKQNVREMKKIKLLSEQQALKEAQGKIRTRIEGEQHSNKMSHYKKILKILYDKMFDLQNQMIRSQ